MWAGIGMSNTQMSEDGSVALHSVLHLFGGLLQFLGLFTSPSASRNGTGSALMRPLMLDHTKL